VGAEAAKTAIGSDRNLEVGDPARGPDAPSCAWPNLHRSSDPQPATTIDTAIDAAALVDELARNRHMRAVDGKRL